MPLPSPQPGETQSDFVARCHNAIHGEYPEADQRNAVCYSQWREANGSTDVEKKALSMFPKDRFEHVKDVCVFAEHETVNKDGEPQQYDREAIQSIVDKCNERILDTGDFATLSMGHTPTKDDLAKGAAPAEVGGFAGNFRLGMIGNVKPRYAIYADEYRFKDKSHEISRRPRRSVELWMAPKMSERFFDPIAALGSETPRLDLGVRFAKLGHVTVEKYAAEAVAGGDNTFVPSDDDETYCNDDRYTADQPSEAGAMSPQDIRQFVEALNELDWVQWAKQQMAAESQNAAMETETPMDNAGESEEYMPPEETPEAPTEAPAAPPKAAAEAPPEVPAPSEDEEETYEAEDETMEDRQEEEENTMPYSRTRHELATERARYARLESEHTELKAQVTELQQSSEDGRRGAILERYEMEFVLDLDEERTRCLYSLGSEMTPKSFGEHCDVISKNYKPRLTKRTLPAGVDRVMDRDKYERDTSERAVKHAETERRAGRRCTYQQAWDVVTAKETNGQPA